MAPLVEAISIEDWIPPVYVLDCTIWTQIGIDLQNATATTPVQIARGIGNIDVKNGSYGVSITDSSYYGLSEQ